MGLHQVARVCVSSCQRTTLAASRIDARGRSTRVGPRSRKRQDARKTARRYYTPMVRDLDNNRARPRPKPPPEKRAKKFRILITPFARFEAGYHCPTSMDDDRFIREGRTLREWLPDLIDPAPPTRRRAENAVSAMWWGAPIADATTYLHLPPDPEAHRAE